ncbi:transglycosylase SLT domain-containing protein [Streptomyces albidus (ex Kaewkla and Franco 2022)]|uniref:transglycosylase SLT domain-containing protein n=1 Tax=Streptomyces albidus (ex Kaewkla and Franco 2022) TaxID=722709 RepID=UPI0015EF2927|nr:transglycosylase SLT domain-containing protein [Streptomyces albidus (ex Kaewkla and Franco 2022)]
MPSIPGYVRNPKFTRISAAGISAVSAAAIAFTVIPGSADAGDSSQSPAKKVNSSNAAANGGAPKTQLKTAKQGTLDPDVQRTDADAQRKALAKQKALADERAAAVKDQAAKKVAAAKKAEQERKAEAKAKASRAAKRAAAKPTYPNNLDGWIREARAIMAKHNIPGSYDGIKRNIIRESGGNPNAVNNWDINAQNGTPSKGLLQTIKPTFDAYHVEGTSTNMTDPVANIVAACNYAADRYGSMDNVNSAY